MNLSNLLCITGYNDTDCDDEINNNLSLIDKLPAQISSEGISIGGYQNSEDTLQPLEDLALNTSRSRLSPKQPTLDDNGGNSQGTKGMYIGSPSIRSTFSDNIQTDQ